MRFLPPLLFLLTLLLGYLPIHRAAKNYLATETYLRHLKKGPFLAKLNSPLLPWMEEQLAADFTPLTPQALSQESLAAASQLPFTVRYRIVNQTLYRYFPPSEEISLQDNSTELALKTLLALTPIPDLDLLLSYLDGITAPHPYSAPILSSAKVASVDRVILIPDWRSIGDWWVADIKELSSKGPLFPWEDKKEVALWRGSFTKQIRKKLCELSLLAPELLDAKFNSEADPLLRRELEEAHLFGERVSWEEFLSHKYLPVLDGAVTASPAFQWRLLSGSLTLKPDSDEVQWFYRGVKPYLHYLPLASDLSDLFEKIRWAKEHDEECKAIAERGGAFARESLLYDEVLRYFAAVLKRYGALQKPPRNLLRREIASDPCWVEIHSRKKLAQRAAQAPSRRYTERATPF